MLCFTVIDSVAAATWKVVTKIRFFFKRDRFFNQIKLINRFRDKKSDFKFKLRLWGNDYLSMTVLVFLKTMNTYHHLWIHEFETYWQWNLLLILKIAKLFLEVKITVTTNGFNVSVSRKFISLLIVFINFDNVILQTI